MPHKPNKKEKEQHYSYSEYLNKFRPNKLPDPPRLDPSSDEIAAEIIDKALQRIRGTKEHRVA